MFEFRNTAGRLLGTAHGDTEDEAKSAFFQRYCAEHNMSPRNPEHAGALKGLINWERVVITHVPTVQ